MRPAHTLHKQKLRTSSVVKWPQKVILHPSLTLNWRKTHTLADRHTTSKVNDTLVHKLKNLNTSNTNEICVWVSCWVHVATSGFYTRCAHFECCEVMAHCDMASSVNITQYKPEHRQQLFHLLGNIMVLYHIISAPSKVIFLPSLSYCTCVCRFPSCAECWTENRPQRLLLAAPNPAIQSQESI